MLFNSLHFLVFFPIVTLLYFTLPHRFRWMWLLFASCYFYMAFIPIYILILIFTIIIDYFAGIMIEGARNAGKHARRWLVCSLIANIGVLAVFKYYHFINDNVTALLSLVGIHYVIPDLGIILPIGLSFHTFQAMSYTIEVYFGRHKAERHFGIYALYVMFYPQLVAGPIERPQNLLSQFHTEHHFDYERLIGGLRLMLWGFFKKVVIADRLGIFVNEVYNSPRSHDGTSLLLATYFFAFQIFCDFSAYSDIAIGAAKIMGIDLMKNFDRPYFSKSISEFWHRWHISLSSWFRDYLYIPLGGSRTTFWRWNMNLAVVFLVSGLWHGANWTYVIWGGLHAFYSLFSIWTRQLRQRWVHFIHLDRFPRILKICQVAITFHLVLFAWIFFRANSLSDAFYIIRHLFGNFHWALPRVTRFPVEEFQIAFFFLFLMEVIHLLERRKPLPDMLLRYPIHLRWCFYYVLVFAILGFGKFDEMTFIYFQF